jgi:formamidase
MIQHHDTQEIATATVLDPATATRTVFVSELTNGILDPDEPMLGPVQSGGTILANTAPGCYGPMITPHLRGGHEVTRPRRRGGSRAGPRRCDPDPRHQRDLAGGRLRARPLERAHYLGDPYVAKRCPRCETLWPETRVEGIGPDAVRCADCGDPVHPFQIVHGYAAVFDEGRTVALTLDREGAEKIAREARAMPRSRSAPSSTRS